MSDTLFDKIVAGAIPSWTVWESAGHLAFLTPFPNTLGLTILIPKRNPGSYVFSLPEQEYVGLMLATRTVARILERAFGVPRVAVVVEGTGVPYVHAKLYPLHGPLGCRTDVWSDEQEFFPEYAGYLTTREGPRLDDQELDAVCDRDPPRRRGAELMRRWRRGMREHEVRR